MGLFGTVILSSVLVCAGCQNDTARTESETKTGSSTAAISNSTKTTSDPTHYEFHRNVAFADVTKEMPDGSVDHIDIDMTANPNVIVVVTVTTAYTEGIRFTTTFTGPDGLEIQKEWAPESGGDPDRQYVGLFVLPANVDAGSTQIH